MMNKTKILGALMIMLASATAARASVATFTSLGHEESVTFKHNGSTMTVPAGEILINFNSQDLTAYCVDLDHTLKGMWNADIAPVTDVNGGKAAAFLYDTFHGSVVNDVQAAALQVAIWEVVDDFGGMLNLNHGDFRLLTTGDILTTAQSYLGALPVDVSGYMTSSYLVKSDDAPRSQNLIVPEPAVVALMTVLAPLLLVRGRSKRITNARAA